MKRDLRPRLSAAEQRLRAAGARGQGQDPEITEVRLLWSERTFAERRALMDWTRAQERAERTGHGPESVTDIAVTVVSLANGAAAGLVDMGALVPQPAKPVPA